MQFGLSCVKQEQLFNNEKFEYIILAFFLKNLIFFAYLITEFSLSNHDQHLCFFSVNYINSNSQKHNW